MTNEGAMQEERQAETPAAGAACTGPNRYCLLLLTHLLEHGDPGG